MTPAINHRAAGLVIAADRIVPGLATFTTRDTPDVVVHLGEPGPWPVAPAQTIYRATHTDAAGSPIVVVDQTPHGYRFHYADQTQIWIAADARDVWCTWRPGTALEDTAIYLTGPVLGFLLRLRGALALHASAVQIGRGALLMIGPRGAGKSTSAAALARRGCPVIADDVLHVRRERDVWLAEPFRSSIRLWEEGAALALGRQASLPRLTPTWNKRGLALDDDGVSAAVEAVPVAAAVFLEPRGRAGSTPRLDPISPAEALIGCATHSSASHLLDRPSRAREFLALQHFVRDLRCTRAVASPEADAFPAFVDLLERWARQLDQADG